MFERVFILGKTIPVGWLRNAGNKASLSPALAGTWAELGNNRDSWKYYEVKHGIVGGNQS